MRRFSIVIATVIGAALLGSLFAIGNNVKAITGYEWFLVQISTRSKAIENIRLDKTENQRYEFIVKYRGEGRLVKYLVMVDEIGIEPLLGDAGIVTANLHLDNFYFKGCGIFRDEKLTFKDAVIDRREPIEVRERQLIRKYRILTSCNYEDAGYNP